MSWRRAIAAVLLGMFCGWVLYSLGAWMLA